MAMIDPSATDPAENSSNKVDPDQPAQNQGRALSFLSVVSFGFFELDTEREEPCLDGSPIKLSGKPMKILLKLLEKPNGIVTHDELWQYPWPRKSKALNNCRLRRSVSRLRRVLNHPRTQPRYIETIKGAGYRFVESVERSHRHGPRFARRQLQLNPEAHKGIHSQRNSQAVTNSRFIFGGAIVALITAAVVAFGVTFTWLLTSEPPNMGGFIVVLCSWAVVSMILATLGAIPLTSQGFVKPRARD